MNQLRDSKTEVIARIIADHAGPFDRLLVVGCGSGLEAAILGQQLGAQVVGIDIEMSFAAAAAPHARLLTCDARALAFPDDTYDYVYSFHTLEHVPEPQLALREIRRVLRPGGGFFIGTPNRSRMVGYIGSKTATFRQKIAWNLIDWRARLRGKFRNELGAHAGFTAREMGGMLRSIFPECSEATDRYYLEIYRRHVAKIRLILALRLGRWVFPSVYFAGRKTGDGTGA